jgi:hypothetical protein
MGMRVLALALLATLLAACGGTAAPSNVFTDLVACLAVRPDADPASFPSLVDRADAIVRAKVERVAPIDNGHSGAARVTLRIEETVKGTTAAELLVYDAPCPLLSARTGESYVLFLDGAELPDGTVQLLYAPPGVARESPTRPLTEVVAALRAIRPLDRDAGAIFERFGWTVGGKNSVDEFDLPPLSDFGLAGRSLRGAFLAQTFARYSELSNAVGLDLRAAAGLHAEMLTFFLDGTRVDFHPRSPVGHVLIAQRRIVGAWVSLSLDGDVFAVSDRAAAIAAPARTGPWTPPPNRVPQGVNIARAYGLADATQISFKTGGGRNADVTDAARIRAFVSALDVTIPTTQATLVTDAGPTHYYFHIGLGARDLSVEYDARDDMLTVLLDGFSAKAPPGFAAIVAGLP